MDYSIARARICVRWTWDEKMNQAFEPKKKKKTEAFPQHAKQIAITWPGKNDCVDSNTHIFAYKIRQQNFHRINETQKTTNNMKLVLSSNGITLHDNDILNVDCICTHRKYFKIVNKPFAYHIKKKLIWIFKELAAMNILVLCTQWGEKKGRQKQHRQQQYYPNERRGRWRWRQNIHSMIIYNVWRLAFSCSLFIILFNVAGLWVLWFIHFHLLISDVVGLNGKYYV